MVKKRLSLGTVLELETAKGVAYVQLSQLHDSNEDGFWYGWYARILPGLFSKRPTDEELESLVSKHELFGAFIGDVQHLRLAGTFVIPHFASAFPVFKQFGGLTPSPEGLWYFWNGQEERVTWRLPSDTVAFPNLEVVAHSLVRERIESEWRPEHGVPSQCIVPATEPFRFTDYPLVSDFWANEDRYGDMFGFLRAHGLINDDDDSARC